MLLVLLKAQRETGCDVIFEQIVAFWCFQVLCKLFQTFCGILQGFDQWFCKFLSFRAYFWSFSLFDEIFLRFTQNRSTVNERHFPFLFLLSLNNYAHFLEIILSQCFGSYLLFLSRRVDVNDTSVKPFYFVSFQRKTKPFEPWKLGPRTSEENNRLKSIAKCV